MELKYKENKNGKIRQNPRAAKFWKNYSTKYMYFGSIFYKLKSKVKLIHSEINFTMSFWMLLVKYKALVQYFIIWDKLYVP